MRWDDLSIWTTTSARAGADPGTMTATATISPLSQPPTCRPARRFTIAPPARSISRGHDVVSTEAL
jgi:hypothetical protein